MFQQPCRGFHKAENPFWPVNLDSITAVKANRALAANNAGAAAHFIFKVGKDQFSAFAMNHIIQSGITSYSAYQTDKAPTGSALIYVSAVDGDNIIAIYPANMMLTTQEINEQHRYIAESDVMLMQLETNIEALTEFIRTGKQENKMIMLNPAPIRNR